MIDIEIQKGANLLKIDSQEGKEGLSIGQKQLLFVFGQAGKAYLNVPELCVKQVIEPDRVYTFTNPFSQSFINFEIPENSELDVMIVEMATLHSFFGVDFGGSRDQVSSFVSDYKMKKYVTAKDIHPSLKVILYQIFNCSLVGLSRELFIKGKLMEFFSIYVHDPSRKEEFVENCPFVEDNLEMEKIREARKIITQRLDHPPSLKELAREVGTNEFKLKVGFKSLYGSTVTGYLTDYRLETARKMLETSNFSIKEISHHVGYSNPSQFIAYYKKKFGITPKQYLKGSRL